jgi:hypothetical protein
MQVEHQLVLHIALLDQVEVVLQLSQDGVVLDELRHRQFGLGSVEVHERPDVLADLADAELERDVAVLVEDMLDHLDLVGIDSVEVLVSAVHADHIHEHDLGFDVLLLLDVELHWLQQIQPLFNLVGFIGGIPHIR